MMISLNWLNTYLDRAIDVDEADEILTAVGFPLDGREAHGEDWLLDVEVTSNRPDCLSHWGVAREIAAATGREARLLDVAEITDEPLDPDAHAADVIDRITSVTHDQATWSDCPHYTAVVIRNVTVAASPPWLIERIEAIGLRPVNNIVDITNFILHELGQPLHAFDLDRLAERRIVMRHAREDEPFKAIDGSSHQLRSDMLVIADAEKPAAVAGVMGGIDSEVTESTKDILLEAARFDPLSVRRTARALKLSSDSSYRFERGVDPHGVLTASQRAAQMILTLTGGQLAEGVLQTGSALPEATHTVTMRPARCAALLGYPIDTPTMIRWLDRLNLKPRETGDRIECTIPSYRLDLHREADLIEEVARLNHYDTIHTLPHMAIRAQPEQHEVNARQRTIQTLVSLGYHETITFSFTPDAMVGPFLQPGESVIEIREDHRRQDRALRPSLIPSLLEVRKTNQDVGNEQVKLFEIAQIFRQIDGQYHEATQLALLADAEDMQEAFRTVRSEIDELATHLGATMSWSSPAQPPAWASHALVSDHAVIAAVDAKLTGQVGLQKPVIAACCDFHKLIADYPPLPDVQAPARYPAIGRDLSVIVDEAVTWQQIEQTVTQLNLDRLETVAFVTLFRGKPIDPGAKSVTLHLRFRDPQRTLRHDEVDPQIETVIATLATTVNATVRQ